MESKENYMVREGKMDLTDLVCVITGAGGAVGSQLVEEFRARGSKVVAIVHGSRTELVEQDSNYFSIESDLIDGENTRKALEAILDRFGRIDVLINAAGGFQAGKPVEETSMEQWKNMLSINFITTLNCCRIVLPAMKKQGRGKLINFGSSPGEDGMAEASAYAVSKAAVHALTKSISKETRDLNVDAIVVVPDTIDTPQNRRAMPGADTSTWLKPQDLGRQLATLIKKDDFDANNPVVHIHQSEDSQVEKPESILSVFDQVESTSAEIEDEAQADKGDEQVVEETPEESPAQEEEPRPVSEESKPDDSAEIEEDNSIDVDSNMVTFSMVTHLKSRGLYQRALEVLDALLQKGGDEDRVIQEKKEIQEMLGIEPLETEEKPEEEKSDTAPDSETETPEEEPEPKQEKPDEANGEESETSSILIKSEDTVKEQPEPEKPAHSEAVETSENEEEKTQETAPVPEEEDSSEADEQTSASSLLKSIKGISTSTLTLLVVLIVVSFLSIQDQLNPNTSLVTKMISLMTGYYPPSGPEKKTPSGEMTVMVSGFIDTLSDQDEDSTGAHDSEGQAADTTVMGAVPGTTLTVVGEESTLVVPAVPQDTMVQETSVTSVGAKIPESSVKGTVIEDTLTRPVEEHPVKADTAETPPAPVAEELFAEKRFHEAARAWAEEKKPLEGHYTIVLEYVCKETTVRNAFKAVNESKQFFLLPKEIKGQDCFIICYGDFEDLPAAQAQLEAIPAWFRENGAKPRVRPLKKIL